MPLQELKDKHHSIIEKSIIELLPGDLFVEPKHKINTTQPHEADGLFKEDYDQLISLVNEPDEKDSICYDEIKELISKWSQSQSKLK